MPSLAELQSDPGFQKLSPEARSIVFDKVSTIRKGVHRSAIDIRQVQVDDIEVLCVFIPNVIVRGAVVALLGVLACPRGFPCGVL